MVAQGALGAVMRGVGLGAAGLRARGGDPVELGLQARDRVVAVGLVAFGFGGVVADDEALGRVAVADADLLDAQVVADGLVAALARERLLRVGAAVAHPLAGDPVPARAGEVAQVLVGAKAAVDDGDDPAEPPASEVVLDLAG